MVQDREKLFTVFRISCIADNAVLFDWNERNLQRFVASFAAVCEQQCLKIKWVRAINMMIVEHKGESLCDLQVDGKNL